MPIEMPKRLVSATGKVSDFVLCENFVFRLASVDGFSHQNFEDGAAVTTVNFKGYTQSISDPEHRLFDFLVSNLNPKPVTEDV